MPCFGSGNPGVAPSLGRFQYIDKMASRDAPIEVSDEEEDQLVGAGPQNPEEARSYHEKVNAVFMNIWGTSHRQMSRMPFRTMVASLKKVDGQALGWYGRG